MPDTLHYHIQQVRRIVMEAVREGAGRERVRRLVQEYFRQNRVGDRFKEDLLSRASSQHEWITSHASSSSHRRAASYLIEQAGEHFARVQGRIEQRVANEVMRALRNDVSSSVLERRIMDVAGAARNMAWTITNTALGGFDRASAIIDAQDAGLERFELVGPPSERDFCEAHLGRQYSLQEIEKLDNMQGLPVLIYAGGFNCRHHWRPVVPRSFQS